VEWRLEGDEQRGRIGGGAAWVSKEGDDPSVGPAGPNRLGDLGLM
jgi:hypothetical protein